jgi:arsenate reductase-like glutaredoxin family protein
LRSGGIEADEINYAKAGLAEATVRDIVARAGSVAAVLNTRHAMAKEKGWVASPPSAAEFARAVVADVNLLRRPIVIDGDRVIVGFDREAYQQLAKTKKPAKKPAPK